MGLENLISIDFSGEELSELNGAMEAIESIMKGKLISLTPEQRKYYGRVAYEKEKWIDKVFGYMMQYPDSVPPYINMEEHVLNMEAHRILVPRISRIVSLLQQMHDTNMLLGYSIDHNSRAYYRSQGEAAKENDPGAITRYQDMKQQFNGGKRTKKNDEK